MHQVKNKATRRLLRQNKHIYLFKVNNKKPRKESTQVSSQVSMTRFLYWRILVQSQQWKH